MNQGKNQSPGEVLAFLALNVTRRKQGTIWRKHKTTMPFWSPWSWGSATCSI